MKKDGLILHHTIRILEFMIVSQVAQLLVPLLVKALKINFLQVVLQMLLNWLGIKLNHHF